MKLQNGRDILVSVVNYELEISDTRRGAGVVIAFDRNAYDEDLFVTWNVYPSTPNQNDPWLAEAGHYGLTWDQAIEDMLDRFYRFKFAPKMLSMYEGEPF